MNFEDAIKRLGEISEKMENPDLPLEVAVKLYSEATELADFCQKNLGEAKLSIEKINSDNKKDIHE